MMETAVCEPEVYTVERMFSDFLKRMNTPKKTDNKKPVEGITINRIYEIEPKIKSAIDEAQKVKKPCWEDYSHYKKVLEPLVGYESEKGEICSEEAYVTVIGALCDALGL